MDFAKKQLEKYGWKEGKGLGKNEDGMATALKPKLKFDKSGVGHSPGAEITDKWWENAYKNALSNIEVKKKDDFVTVTVRNEQPRSYGSKQSKNLDYGLFIKATKITEDRIEHLENVTVLTNGTTTTVLNDDELFAACGGRTAHKGARHGLKLSGKLSRIEKQEKMLLRKLQNVSICDEKKDIEKKMKKIAKHRDKSRGCINVEDGLSVLNLEDDSRSSGSSTTKKKNKKRERKSVSFNETVTEYHTQDLDTSTQSSDSNETSIVLTVIEKSKIRDEEVKVNNKDDINVLDEGIEQDIDARNSTDCDHKSFEEAQCSSTEKLSKAERKLKKKNRAMLQFLQEVNKSEIEDEVEAYYGCKKCMKRKHMDAEELEDRVYMKRYCNKQDGGGKKNKHKKPKEKKWKQKSQEQKISSITRSLDRVCSITDKK